MDTVVTLICNPAAPALTDVVIAGAVDALYARGLREIDRRDLAAGVAADIFFAGDGDLKAIRRAITSRLELAPVDVAVQPMRGRRKRLLVADMDSTIIAQECLDELADFAGKRVEISAITARAMRGEIEFEGALLERLAMLKGLPESALERTFAERISLNPGARTLVRTMRKHGAHTALVSGGFTFFTERVAAAAGFDRHDANVLKIEDGVLAGEVERPIRGKSAKEEALRRFAREEGVALAETLAVGDGANDLAMLARAGLGVAYRAKPAVAAAAHASIRHGDLTALLYLQGIPQAEFSE